VPSSESRKPQNPQERGAQGEPAPSAPPATPRRFANRFQQVSEVDRGGIGCIDAAEDPVLRRRVAIKTLLPELQHEREAASRFAEEAQITGQLEHPNIVPIYDLGAGERGPFIVMKLIRGKSLTTLISEAHARGGEPEELQHFVQTLLRLCDALSFAHSRGVFHCDLKADNVMVGDYGQVYLMDWGVALLRSRRDSLEPSSDEPLSERRATAWEREDLVRVTPRMEAGSSNVRGTPAYMSPEQVLGRVAEIDERTDVFGLGGILYEILTGQPPNDWEHLKGPGLNHPLAPLPTSSALWPQLPPELCRIALKALAPRREDRYESVAAFAADLTQFLKGGGWFETRRFAAGESVVVEGELGDTAYIIESGRLDVWKNIGAERVLVRSLGPGDVFGETAVLTGTPRTASVVAAEDSTLKVITGGSLNRELDRNPWLAAFVRSLAALFRETDERLSRPTPPPREP
jgi:eukaryotic-like serine/threonine-protein kinase